MRSLGNKISVENIADVLFCLFLVMSFLSERSILGRSTMFLFIGICLFLIVLRGSIAKLPFYFVLEIIFIGYCIFQVLSDISVDQSASIDMIYTLSICTLVYIMLYNYAILKNNFKHMLKLFFLSYFGAIVINLIIDAGTLFESRSGTGIEIGGVQIGGVTPISVGWMAGICMVLATIVYKKDKKKFWLVFVLLLLALLSAGTRKAFLFVPIAMLGWFYFNKRSKNILKLFSYIIIVTILCIIGYYITISNPTLYSIVGYRFESVVIYITSDKGNIDDASMLTRLSLIETAKFALSERPFAGWGLDNFRYIFNSGGYYSHSNFFEILVSGGWIGFVIYYMKYLYVMFSLWFCRRYADNQAKNRINILLLLTIVMIVLEYWQVTYYTRKFMMVWVLILIYVQSVRTSEKSMQIPIEYRRNPC
ncbi:O-antigen ligase family protein [Halobacillus kuroshimensis]|uniref:O-antigen ligase family protein n=1 Tax=Halobacillus kuroshimensis TaxID=302481 RepID=UPI0003FFF382|nr:O-antigen ligase family protein [Halobacillus kuroshimensis]